MTRWKGQVRKDKQNNLGKEYIQAQKECKMLNCSTTVTLEIGVFWDMMVFSVVSRHYV
jgi:hypothetical protein